MALLIDRVHSAMSELRKRPWSSGSNKLLLLFWPMKTFKDQINILARFVDCIRIHSNALEHAPHLVHVVAKVEALVQKIGDQIVEEVNREHWDSMFSSSSISVLSSVEGEAESESEQEQEPEPQPQPEPESFEEKASNWIRMLQNWADEMVALKPDVRDALETLSINSVQCKIPVLRDFQKWSKLIISTYKHVQDVQGSFIPYFFRPFIRYIEAESPYLVRLLSSLENDHIIKDPKVEAFLTKFGDSVISAELLCCQWWCTNKDLFTGTKAITAAFKDLNRMIWLTNPEFVDLILTVLKTTSETHRTIANLVIHRYIPYYDKKRFRIFGQQLISLVYCVLKLQEEEEDDMMMLKMLLPVTKQLLKETTLIPKYAENKDTSIAWNLTEYICLIKIEILLRTQITGNSNNNKVNIINYSPYEMITLLNKSSRRSTANTKMILPLIEEVAKEAPMFPKSTKVVRNLLLKTLLVRGEFMFLKLSDYLPLSSKEYIEFLQEGFRFIIHSIINQPRENSNFNRGKMGFAVGESFASRIISLYQQIFAQQDSSEEMHTPLIDEIKLIMKEIKSSYIQMPVFPCTNAVGFSHSLQGKLRELLNYEMDLVQSIITKEQMSEIVELLEFSRPFLQDPLDHTMPQELKDLCTIAVNLTYEAEYLIDSVISGQRAAGINIIWVHNFLEEIRDLKIQLSQNQVKRTNEVKVHMISRETTPDINDDIVSLLDEEQSIIDRLMGGFEKLYSVSIVGMPGIGKTTLAKKVYNSPQVVTHFRRRAWCCVSEVYMRRDVLLEILRHMIPITTDIMGMPDEDLEFKLYKILKTGRYLIVLDDVWDTDVLDDVVRRFPDNGDSSRLLITSRSDHVALKANPDGNPHHLRQLYDNECWKLLQMKVFHGEPCPDKLKKIGEEIAASCKGLPLAVIAIAGLLQRIKREYNQWKDIADSLSSKIIDDPQEQWRHILELSYENLPDYLKACFLYFGGFPEDQDIPAWKLMQLWIAEGFVPKTDLKTLEDVAEDYLMDLISRSLIMLSKQSSLGGAKTCRIHDVLRKVCQSKAKEDNFLQVITMSDASSNATTLHDLDYEFSANFENPTSSSVTHEEHRLCFCSNRKHFIHSRPLGPHVRSLLCFANGDEDPKYPYNISFISQNFRFLKVLDLECINMGTSFAEDILLLVQLKYLAVSGYIHSIPSSISKLWNLKTFIVKGGSLGKVKLPHHLWSLKRLRHVRVCPLASLDFEGNSSELQLDCLVTVSSVILPSGEMTDCFLKKCHNLRKLKCIFFKSPQEAAEQNCNQFPSFEVLNELESLKITYYGQIVGSVDFSFPSNLKKLTLENFRLPWEKISVINRLQNLEVLKLQSQAFAGEEWEMVEGGEFLHLKYLKLENLDLAKWWNANGDNLPKLKTLVLRSCKNLEIPTDILEVPTLQIIDVQWCGETVENSARQMREEGDEKLKIFINFAELQIPSA